MKSGCFRKMLIRSFRVEVYGWEIFKNFNQISNYRLDIKLITNIFPRLLLLPCISSLSRNCAMVWWETELFISAQIRSRRRLSRRGSEFSPTNTYLNFSKRVLKCLPLFTRQPSPTSPSNGMSPLERCWHFQLQSESYALSIIVRLVSVWLHRSWRPARVLAGWCIEATPCDLSVNILSSLNQCHWTHRFVFLPIKSRSHVFD